MSTLLFNEQLAGIRALLNSLHVQMMVAKIHCENTQKQLEQAETAMQNLIAMFPETPG